MGIHLRPKNSEKILCRVKPDSADTLETVWDTKDREILALDLDQGWIYYSEYPPAGSVEEDLLYADTAQYIKPTVRCRLDQTGKTRFSDRTAFAPVSIGKWIYFSAADENVEQILMMRFNPQTGKREVLCGGLLRDLQNIQEK